MLQFYEVGASNGDSYIGHIPVCALIFLSSVHQV
jgi:hypothetical protein